MSEWIVRVKHVGGYLINILVYDQVENKTVLNRVASFDVFRRFWNRIKMSPLECASEIMVSVDSIYSDLAGILGQVLWHLEQSGIKNPIEHLRREDVVISVDSNLARIIDMLASIELISSKMGVYLSYLAKKREITYRLLEALERLASQEFRLSRKILCALLCGCSDSGGYKFDLCIASYLETKKEKEAIRLISRIIV